jgi:LPPG:FO 2-phospho-L-lactate transferase
MRKDGAMHIVVLAGGIGGARFLLGVRALAGSLGATVTAVINVGDDVTLHGLRICPDLDSVMYTLGGGADEERGWGRAGETWSAKEELAAYGAEPTWFGLGDRDIATHLVRTRMLEAGYPLSAVTEALCDRWQPGVRLLPATTTGRKPTSWSSSRAKRAHSISRSGGYDIEPRCPPGASCSSGRSPPSPPRACSTRWPRRTVVLIAPSNPVVSIAPILAVPGLRDAVAGGPRPVVGCRRSSAAPGARAWPIAAWPRSAWSARPRASADSTAPGPRRRARRLAGRPGRRRRDRAGVTVRENPLWMSDEAATAAMVRAALDGGGAPAEVPDRFVLEIRRSRGSATSRPATTRRGHRGRPRRGCATATCSW